MDNRITYLCIYCSIFICFACEEPFIPDTSGEPSQLVVEGYIEAGQESLPAFVILAKSLPFYNTIDSSVLDDYFVREAVIRVNDGQKEVILDEVCLSDLPANIGQEIRQNLGILGNFPDFCLYIDVQDQLDRKQGGTYSLNIESENKVVTAVTTIPPHIPIDSFRFDDPVGKPNDTLAQLHVTISDIAGQLDLYRYLTGVYPRPVFASLASVIDDSFFDGKSFEFPLSRHPYEDEDLDLETFGLFERGDSITLKWCNLDQEHYNFWSTLEFNSNNQGPFASYTRIDSNIDGGIGIWGGYSVSFIRARVPGK